MNAWLEDRNPIKIAEYANIRIAILPLGNIAGNYKLINRKRWIFINDSIPADSPLFEVVAAHELGHALLHRKENCAFIKNKTLLLTSGIEREANEFAAQLLISEDLLQAYSECTQSHAFFVKMRLFIQCTPLSGALHPASSQSINTQSTIATIRRPNAR